MSGFTGLFKGISKKFSSKGGQTGNQQVVKPTDDEKKAISELSKLTEEVKKKSNKISQQDYTTLSSEIENLKASAGNSSEALAAKEAIDKEMLALEDKRKKYDAKQPKYAKIIADERKTPLETLIKKQQGLTDGITPEGLTEEQAKQQQQQQSQQSPAPAPASLADKIKAKAEKYIKKPITARVKAAFADWKSGIDTVTGLLGGLFDKIGDKNGLAGDIKDTVDVVKGELKREDPEYDKSAGGIIGSITSGLSAFVKSIKFVTDMVKEGQTDAEAGDEVIRDHQERWKLARGYIRDLKDIFFGFHDIFAPLTAAIPLYGSISSIVSSGADMMMDVVEMADTSFHIDRMRKERNRIYKRIEDKKAKYEGGNDTAAAKAYTVTHKKFRKQNRDVDAHRKLLMETVFANEINDDSKKIAESSLRSRNDSQYREIQYGIGKRINEKAGNKSLKSQRRQLEALEMMQEYRTVDKAHKKMCKKLGHILEDIIKGGVSIAADGLKLAGEVTLAAGGAGAGLMAAGLGTSLTLSGYEGIRSVGSKTYALGKRLSGTKKNKDTTREDMAIFLIDKMEEIAKSAEVWDGTGFKDDAALNDPKHRKAVIRQGHNVEHLHKVLRSGLDVTMSDLIQSDSKADLKDKIAESFGQD